MIKNISIIVITKNAEHSLNKMLSSVEKFSEVIIYDNGSEDKTLQIAASFPNVSLHKGDFLGFGKTKNHAVSLASNDWVFSLDADEFATYELVNELENIDLSNINMVGKVLRKNYFMGQLVKNGGWGNDWIIRFFNRKIHNFNTSPVHESVLINSSTTEERLSHPIKHDAVQNIGQFLTKIDRYSEIRRKENQKTYHPFIIFIKSMFTFFRSYIVQKGVLSGWRGLVIAWNESNGTFYKYMKRYIDKQEK